MNSSLTQHFEDIPPGPRQLLGFSRSGLVHFPLKITLILHILRTALLALANYDEFKHISTQHFAKPQSYLIKSALTKHFEDSPPSPRQLLGFSTPYKTPYIATTRSCAFPTQDHINIIHF